MRGLFHFRTTPDAAPRGTGAAGHRAFVRRHGGMAGGGIFALWCVSLVVIALNALLLRELFFG